MTGVFSFEHARRCIASAAAGIDERVCVPSPRGCGSDQSDHIVSLASKPFRTLPKLGVRRALGDKRVYLRGFAKVTRDDTALKRTEAALRESAERFRSLFYGVSVGVVLSGPDAQVRKCNQAALDLLGVTEDQLVGRTSFDPAWQAINEDGSPCPAKEFPIPRAITTRQPVRNAVVGVYRSRAKDWVWLLRTLNRGSSPTVA